MLILLGFVFFNVSRRALSRMQLPCHSSQYITQRSWLRRTVDERSFFTCLRRHINDHQHPQIPQPTKLIIPTKNPTFQTPGFLSLYNRRGGVSPPLYLAAHQLNQLQISTFSKQITRRGGVSPPLYLAAHQLNQLQIRIFSKQITRRGGVSPPLYLAAHQLNQLQISIFSK
jgi:hypothetical protein